LQQMPLENHGNSKVKETFIMQLFTKLTQKRGFMRSVKSSSQRYSSWKMFKMIIFAGIGLLLAACGDSKDSDKKIVLGFGPSTYAEQFEKGIRPILEAQGYEVVVKILSQNMQINPALKDGSIDVAGHQSIA